MPDFDDHATAFRAKPTMELARSLAVFSACGYKPLVKNADCLIPACCSLLGPGLTHGVVKHTFFSHFCAGEFGFGFWHSNWPGDSAVMH